MPELGLPKTIILCGGRGTRLRPLTDQMPKPLLPLKGKPILQYLIESYLAKGVREFILCTGYQGEQIRAFVSGLGVNAVFSFSDAGEHASILQRLHEAKGLMGTRVFVAYGDTLLDVDLPAMHADHVASGASATIATATVQSPFGLVQASTDRWVGTFQEKPKQSYYVGHMLLERSVLENVAEDWLVLPDGAGLVRLFEHLAARRTLRIFPYTGPAITFNTPRGLVRAERDVVHFFTHPEESRCS